MRVTCSDNKAVNISCSPSHLLCSKDKGKDQELGLLCHAWISCLVDVISAQQPRIPGVCRVIAGRLALASCFEAAPTFICTLVFATCHSGTAIYRDEHGRHLQLQLPISEEG